MSRNTCSACTMIKAGVKSRKALKHAKGCPYGRPSTQVIQINGERLWYDQRIADAQFEWNKKHGL